MRAPPSTKAPVDTNDVVGISRFGEEPCLPNEARPSEVGVGRSQGVCAGGNRYVLGIDATWYNDFGTQYWRKEPNDDDTMTVGQKPCTKR